MAELRATGHESFGIPDATPEFPNGQADDGTGG